MTFGRATRGDRSDPLQKRRVVWLVKTAGSTHELETRADLATHLYIEAKETYDGGFSYHPTL